MRHQVRKKKLNLPQNRRSLLLKGLATSLILHEKIKITRAKAKVLQSVIEKLIRDAKNPNKMIAIRKVNTTLQNEVAARKLLDEIIQKFQDKQSGFTRITKLGYRAGDAAEMVQIELTTS